MTEMPGESFWVPFADLLTYRSYAVVGQKVKVRRGPHAAKSGIVRAVDGGTDMVQIRTGDPAAWEAYDVETRRMLAERGWPEDLT